MFTEVEMQEFFHLHTRMIRRFERGDVSGWVLVLNCSKFTISYTVGRGRGYTVIRGGKGGFGEPKRVLARDASTNDVLRLLNLIDAPAAA